MDIVAKFLGHDIRIHREFYRLPDETLQVAKVSKLLLAMENGTFLKCKGKNLEDIDVNLDEDIVLEGESDSDDDDDRDKSNIPEIDLEEESDDEDDESYFPEEEKKKKGIKQSRKGTNLEFHTILCYV
ncbi:uncharacterized protein LOC135500139 [Lineus longissimus]|uniref:uncharacterized protein LOC135500139 n=1 Tax=Lineus longissimus TaxID=88925 RepID=UPI00315DBF60